MSLAITLAFFSALGFGTTAVLARVGLERVSPTVGVFISLSTGAVFTLILSAIFHSGDVLALTPAAFLWFLLFAIITFPMARLLNYTAIKLAGTARTSPMLALSPIFATGLALIALGERPGWMVVAGIMVTVIGMTLILSDRRRDAA